MYKGQEGEFKMLSNLLDFHIIIAYIIFNIWTLPESKYLINTSSLKHWKYGWKANEYSHYSSLSK